ncbi:DUF4870 domain-containing protein [Bacillus timonensis]|nr:DUF4870 domain-containing protein [Bacillus timonensis]
MNETYENLTSDDRLWGMLSHIGAFLGCFIPFGNVLAPLVVYFMKKETSPYVTEHAKESLNFQISVTIYGIISGILALVFIGFFLLLALGIFALVVMILAGIKANEGKMYRYPLCIRFIK